ncbi:MAG: phosphatidate cytidylyltransferase [Treponema sp.]|nr:phosphatidate cytidylyltransferase [Candidatus Treponema equifaecale]
MKYFCVQNGIEFKKQLISLRKEVFRKTIHICTAFVPLFLGISRSFTLIALACAGVVYIIAELLRHRGIEIPLISTITAAAARKRDENKFVLGPVTLVAGVLLAAIFLEYKSASAGIYALAFGDGLASLAGKAFGRIKIPMTHGKTAAGSLTCFLAIFCSCFCVTQNTHIALASATIGAVVEVLPLKDFDNLIIPSLIGFVVTLLS